jgi:hypothetical protein
VTVQIRKTGRGEYGNFIKALVYGVPGSGKTLFGSTASNVLFINLEAGLMTLHSRGIDYVDARDPEEMHEILMFLRQPNHGYKTVVIDTLDELQKVLIANRLKKERREQMVLQDWGYVGDQMEKILRAYRNLPLNVLFLCHSSTESDADSGVLVEKPALQGAIKDKVAGFVDLATYISASTTKTGEDVEVVRTLRFQPSARYPQVKDRSGKLPGMYRLNCETDFDDIFKTIYGDTSQIVETEVVQTIDIEPPPPPVEVDSGGTGGPVRAKDNPTNVKELKADPPTDAALAPKPSRRTKVVPAVEKQDDLESAVAVLTEAFPGTKEVGVWACSTCEKKITENVADLSKMRYGKYLCKDHFLKK